jgi:nucleoside-diphosphate-sugar epimerase
MCKKTAHECWACVQQAKKLLGWEPKVQLREGLASMVDDFKHRLHLDEQ